MGFAAARPSAFPRPVQIGKNQSERIWRSSCRLERLVIERKALASGVFDAQIIVSWALVKRRPRNWAWDWPCARQYR